MIKRKRFASHTKVWVINPGISAVVIRVDDEPSVFGEYLHQVRVGNEERQEPGCNLDLIPIAQG